MRSLVVVTLVGAALGAGCLRKTEYACTSNVQCDNGTCESVGFCSFPDSECESGRRFGEFADPQYASKCVGDLGIPDAGIGSDATGLGCPTGYAALNGSAHMYRVVGQQRPWNDHRTSCAADGPNVYLAIPDDMTELAALNAAVTAGNRFWIGIEDQDGDNTFTTVLGAPASFLPWASGEPANGECVTVVRGAAELDARRCDEELRAVCECAP